MGIYIPSEEEVNSRGNGEDFEPLPEDDYVVSVKDYKVVDQPNPYNRTEEYPGGVPRPVLNVRLNVHQFSNGDDLYDRNGNPLSANREPLFFDFIDVTKTGMKPRPSKFRLFIAAVFGRPVGESFEISSWEELLGKRFIASVGIKTRENGDRNNVTGYKPVRKRPTPQTSSTTVSNGVNVTSVTQATPPADPVAVAEAAKDIFGDDLAF